MSTTPQSFASTGTVDHAKHADRFDLAVYMMYIWGGTVQHPRLVASPIAGMAARSRSPVPASRTKEGQSSSRRRGTQGAEPCAGVDLPDRIGRLTGGASAFPPLPGGHQ